MKQKLTLLIAAASMLLVSLSAQAQPVPVLKDALRLSGGTVVVCNLLSANTSKIVVQTASGNKTYARTQVAAVLLGTGAVSGNTGASGSAETCASFDVELTDIGARKVTVIKAVKSITGLGLKESKELVESAPKNVKEDVPQSEADSIKATLEEAGATATIKCAN